MAKTELVVIKLQLDDKGVVTNINQINKALLAAGTSAKVAQKGFATMESAAGIAGSTVTEFGRLVSDLPYGIQGVANNLSQLGSMFALLTVEASKMQNNLSTAQNTFNLIKAQILGPVGILVAFQGLIAALEAFSKSQSKANKEVENFNEEVFLETEALKNLQEQLTFIGDNEEERLKRLTVLALANKDYRKVLEDENLTVSEKVKRGEALLSNQLAINEATDSLARSYKVVSENQELGAISAEQYAQALKELEGEGQQVGGTFTSVGGALIKTENVTESNAQAVKDLYEAQENIRIQSELLLNLERAKQNLFEKGKAYIDGSVDDIKNQIKALEDQRDALAATNEQIDLYNDKISKLKIKLSQLLEGEPVKAENIFDAKGIVENLTGEMGRDNLGKETWKVVRKDIVDQLAEAIDPEEMQKDLQKRVSLRKGELKMDELLGLKEQAEKIGKKADLIKQAASSINDILSAQADREIAIEKNKTTKINDQLKARLANEQLSADERDKINQQISRNEAKLVEKQNEIARKQFKREKALKIVMALADTASSASKAYLSQFLPIPTPDSPVRGTAAAALATAFGLAQVAALTRLKYTEQGMPTPALVSQGGAGGGIAPQAPSFNVVGASGQNQLAAAISGQFQEPVRAYVVSSDVTSAQELDRRIVQGASI